MYEAGDLLITTDEATVWASEKLIKEQFTIPVGEPVLFLGTQSPIGTRLLHVLTTKGVGWIGFFRVVVCLDANGDEVDLEEIQGYTGVSLENVKEAMGAFAPDW
jgi:hypothetical protein